ncbi:MAG TPA: hypothetical protein VNQ34_02725 [Xanthobacteraceae bacterium]|jgi:hypothetical protein|nr:hypothetical protein [Xanthobacteraceae bacterium]
MQSRTIAAIASLTILLGGCAGGGHQQAPVQPEVPDGVGKVAQHGPATGPARCANAINAYEKIIDHDVSTGYLSQSVYDKLIADINAGPRQSCAANRDGDAVMQLSRIKTAHGYR